MIQDRKVLKQVACLSYFRERILVTESVCEELQTFFRTFSLGELSLGSKDFSHCADCASDPATSIHNLRRGGFSAQSCIAKGSL